MNLLCHANGFPPSSYQELLDLLPFPIHTVELAPLKRTFNDVDQQKNWHHLGEEFISDVKKLRENQKADKMTAIGHSMGGVMILRAACFYPDWFERIVLIDPTFLPEPFVWLSNYLPRFINRKIHPVASKTFKRREHWQSKQEAFDSFRKKKFFSSFSDQGLWNYVNAVMIDSSDGGVRLGYSKAWEEHCFLSVINVWPLIKKCQVPIIGITGKHSELMHPKIISRWKKLSPEAIIYTLEKSGHMLPFERPQECADLMIPYLSSNSPSI